MATVRDAKWTDDTPVTITRLSNLAEVMPGFENNTDNGPAIRVLGPVEFVVNGGPAIRRFGSTPSQNTMGAAYSCTDFGRTRTLLTGDLNKKSQRTLLNDYIGHVQEPNVTWRRPGTHHHGSDDVSYAPFLQAMRFAATGISSGDNEGHDHPRPAIIAASATTGYFKMANDELVSPLVCSTDSARSTASASPNQLTPVRRALRRSDAD